jgi:hypothetical protein
MPTGHPPPAAAVILGYTIGYVVNALPIPGGRSTGYRSHSGARMVMLVLDGRLMRVT